MRIALFQAYRPGRPYQESLPALGLGYLMAYAKRHHPSAEVFFCPTEDDLLKNPADIAAISTTSETFDAACRAAEAVRDAFRPVLVLGGNHITALPHTLPRVFDVGVLGEGEQTFLELIQLLEAVHMPTAADYARIAGLCFHGDNGRVVQTPPREPIRNLDSLPYPDRDGLGFHWRVPYSRTVHLIASRGCPYQCTFCASSRLWKGFRVFTAPYVIGEIEHVRTRYGTREIHFFDDLFIGHRTRFREFCRLATERGLTRDLVFRTHARADLINEEMADLLVCANFRFVDFGIESNTAETLAYLGKRGISPETNQRAIDLLFARGLSVGLSMIIGSPDETRTQIEETFDFLRRNQSKMDRLSVGLLVPLPGTPVWDEALARGLVSETMEWDRLGIDFESGDLSRCVLMSRHLDLAEMTEVFSKFYQLAQVVNARGQVRQLTDENGALRGEIQWLRTELDSLKGSRLVRAALKLRALLNRK
ncbi:MAG: B12-binding domain-containing radical SAM protein [Candidatus Sumerlaeia bacterium]|nr:B12-binding domain-containing radical SAM protein [Candidatus Sumerlaeia bacterium]